MDVAASVLTGDPVAGVEILGGQDGRQQELEALSDRELLRKASREMLIAIRLVSYVLRSQLPHLMATKTMEAATLLNALNAGLRFASATVVGGSRLACSAVASLFRSASRRPALQT
jgi:hypothetical protein